MYTIVSNQDANKTIVAEPGERCWQKKDTMLWYHRKIEKGNFK